MLPICSLSILYHVVKVSFLSKPGGWFRSNWPIWASPLRISFDSYPDVWHQRRASNPNTYRPCSVFLSTEKQRVCFHSSGLLQSLLSAKSHNDFLHLISSLLLKQKNHPFHRLPVCYSCDLERFILDLWTWTHLTNSYKHWCYDCDVV